MGAHDSMHALSICGFRRCTHAKTRGYATFAHARCVRGRRTGICTYALSLRGLFGNGNSIYLTMHNNTHTLSASKCVGICNCMGWQVVGVVDHSRCFSRILLRSPRSIPNFVMSQCVVNIGLQPICATWIAGSLGWRLDSLVKILCAGARTRRDAALDSLVYMSRACV